MTPSGIVLSGHPLYTSGVPFSLARSISKHLVPWTQYDWPLDWASIFGREAPLRLEVGFGNAEFLERSALDHPEVDWVAIEVSWASVVRLLKRIHRLELSNVRVIHGDAALAVKHLFADGALDEVIANHSDPWPKSRHHGRRLIQTPFVQSVGACLRMEGRAVILTDHDEYAEWITGILEGQDLLESSFATPWVDRLPGREVTKYQQKGIEAGSTIHHFVWYKTRNPEPQPEKPRKVLPMTNVLLTGVFEFPTLLAGFSGTTIRETHRGEPVVVQFRSPYLREDGKEWIIEARLKEGDFAQHLLFSVERRGEDRILAKPADVGSPRPTWGTRRALGLLVDHVLATQPGLAIHSSGVEGHTPGP